MSSRNLVSILHLPQGSPKRINQLHVLYHVCPGWREKTAAVNQKQNKIYLSKFVSYAYMQHL